MVAKRNKKCGAAYIWDTNNPKNTPLVKQEYTS